MLRTKIRIPKKRVSLNNSFEESWEHIRNALDKVFNENTAEVSFEETYRVIYDVVMEDDSERLYDTLKSYFTVKFGELIQSNNLLKDAEAVSMDYDTLLQDNKANALFLEKLCKFWKSQKQYYTIINDLMIYLNKVYCNRYNKLEIADLAIECFRDVVLLKINDPLIYSTISLFTEERQKYENFIKTNHYHIDNCDVRINTAYSDVIKILVGLMETISKGKDSFYVEYFEPTFVKVTEKFYNESVDWSNLTTIETFNKIALLFNTELNFVKDTLNSDTTNKISLVLYRNLVDGKLHEIIKELIPIAVKDGESPLLNNIYSLSPLDKYKSFIRNAIKSHILHDLQSLNMANESYESNKSNNKQRKNIIAIKWIDDLMARIEFYRESLSLTTIFQQQYSGVDKNTNTSDQQMKNTNQFLLPVVSQYINMNISQSIQFICTFIDFNLKLTINPEKSSHAKTSLRKIMKLMNVISDNDEFIELYKQQLSRRLLQERSNIKDEKFMIQQINNEMGSIFTSRLDTMIKDMEKSADLSKQFSIERSNITDDNSKNNFIPQILTINAWPFSQLDQNSTDTKEIILPREMEKKRILFETMYMVNHEGRVLNWNYHMGLVEIGFRFTRTYHNLVMPVFSASIFSLFNPLREYTTGELREREEDQKLTFEDICQRTNIPDREVLRHLITLSVAPRYRILTKTPMSRNIEATDVFTINYEFTAPTETVKIQTVVATASSQQAIDLKKAQEEKLLARDRLMNTNAAIVRVLKSQRTLLHQNLFDHTAETLKGRFTLDPQTFKKSLVNLMDKEYIQRDPEDPSIYHYIV